MNIYVSEELGNLRKELRTRGYEITNNSNSQYDAIVCNLSKTRLSNIISMQMNTKENGVLIVDSNGKSIEEIEHILESKKYGNEEFI